MHEATARTVIAEQVGAISGDTAYRAETVYMLKRAAFVVALLSALAFLLSQKASLIQAIDHPISKIQVSGEFKNLNRENVQSELASIHGMGFLAVNLDKVKTRVESLPWVYRATVTRVWPGEIQLTVVEQEAVSYWNQNSLLNPQGEVFTPKVRGVTIALPVLIGAKNSSAQMRIEMFNMFSYLQEQIQVYGVNINQMELKSRGVWDMTLKNGISVALGNLDSSSKMGLDNLDAKLERVGKIFSARAGVQIEGIERIDARYPNGVAIKWKDKIATSKT